MADDDRGWRKKLLFWRSSFTLIALEWTTYLEMHLPHVKVMVISITEEVVPIGDVSFLKAEPVAIMHCYGW